MSAEPIKCLIIHTGAPANLFRNLMALRAVKQLYPQLELHLLVSEKSFDLAARVSWIKTVYPFAERSIKEAAESKTNSRPQMIQELASWLRPLVQAEWSFLVNWSFSSSSSYLSTLIPAEVKLGLIRRDHSGIHCADDWSLYVSSVVHLEVSQNIHLTDILTTQFLTALQIHVGDPTERTDSSVTSKNFFRINDQFLSNLWNYKNAQRRWITIYACKDPLNIDVWLSVATKILKSNPEINIFWIGTPEQNQKLVNAKIDDQRVSIIDSSETFDLIAACIARSQWVLSSNPYAYHLASLLGTRVLALFRKYSALTSSGPYGNGHYCMILGDQPEKDLAEKILKAWTFAQNEWSSNRLDPGQAVYRSRIRSSVEGGGVIYEAFGNEGLTISKWNALVAGQIARAWFCGWIAPVGQDLKRNQLSPSLLSELRVVQAAVPDLVRNIERAIAYASLIRENCRRLKSDKVMKLSDRKEVEQLGLNIQDIEQQMIALGSTHPSFQIFANMLRVMMHNIPGKSLLEVSQGTIEIYKRMAEGVQLLTRWLNHSLSLARPMSLREVQSKEENA